MTQIEIVDLLKESGVWDEIGYPTCIDKLIDLVAAHEREKQAEREPVIECDCETSISSDGSRLTKCGSDQMRRAVEQGVRSDKGGASPLF